MILTKFEADLLSKMGLTYKEGDFVAGSRLDTRDCLSFRDMNWPKEVFSILIVRSNKEDYEKSV